MLAAWIAALAVVVHAAALLHFALIAHGVCAEHGHLVHAEDSAGTSESEAGNADASFALRAVEADHDHCVSPATEPGELALPAPDFVAVDTVAIAAARNANGAVIALGSAELLSFAPKQSPPA